MKLVHPRLKGQLLFLEGKLCEWIIESPELFTEYLQELYEQKNGKEGGFILSEREEEIDLGKKSEIILNPFDVNINDKKILSKLYSELVKLTMNEEMYLQTQKIKDELEEYFYNLEYQSSYFLQMNREFSFSNLLKTVEVKFQDTTESFLEKLIQYIKIQAELFHCRLIIFVNIRSFLTTENLRILLDEVLRYEVAILLLENQQRKLLNHVNRYIIDNDQCEIF